MACKGYIKDKNKMKLLIIIMIIGFTGCKGGDTDTPQASHCSDLTEYRKVVAIDITTYQISNNICNSITKVVFSSTGVMLSVTKYIDVRYGSDKLQTIYYSGDTLTFIIDTGLKANGVPVFFDYHYVAGDDFIAITSLPSYIVNYIYSEDEYFNKILNDVLYDVVLLEAKESIKTL